MKSSVREEIIDHDAKGLFDIVLDIEVILVLYHGVPQWSKIKNEKEIYADMKIWYSIYYLFGLMSNLIKKIKYKYNLYWRTFKRS